jgi:hypothetical protein
MIKFFRTIRKDLMEQNKTGKPALPVGRYIKYAIGEIILVVIGILIALQINNWNTSRIEKKSEHQILENLKNEFENAVKQMIYLNGIRVNFLSAAERLVEISNENRFDKTKTIDSLMVQTIYSPTFNDPVVSLNALTTSNRLDLISNNTLKVKLMAWPSELEDMIEGEIVENDITNNKYYPLLYRNVDMSRIYKWFKISDINFERKKTLVGLVASNHIKSKYEELFKNQEFINVLHTRVTFLNISKYETELLIGKANEIITIIENELQ